MAELGRGNTLSNRQFCDGAGTLALDQGRDIIEDYDPWMVDHIKGKKDIHGVFIICGDKDSCEAGEALVSKMLGDSIDHIHSLKGNVRTGEARGYEQYVCRPGNTAYRAKLICNLVSGSRIPSPSLDWKGGTRKTLCLFPMRADLGKENEPIRQLSSPNADSVIVMNHPGTNGWTNNDAGQWEPEWAKNGSYFVLRQMEQDVGKFKE